ncbi:YaiI/YqxD family protein [Acidaminobacter sp. JC074]|uniref:YaiI/YqxD family protein n=1 Tax=Acidaminobacter sp. JC074 TaxID=2530199 RepID=UPI001F118F47|nr:YaiI/YqxD family protein [Acidaminobacter sp. JC074]MCH4890616.1 YaiI/YqxD family protein [Acidaminobacter sp. JC074]
MMTLIIDADGCPVRNQAVKMARKFHIKATIVCDINHMIRDNYAEVITVDKGFDSVDFKIVGIMKAGDLVITQDYGLASLVLSKGGYAMDQNGMVYDNDNIEMLLLRRHVSKNIRRSGGKVKGPSKRKREDNLAFEEQLESFLKEKL